MYTVYSMSKYLTVFKKVKGYGQCIVLYEQNKITKKLIKDQKQK